MSGQVDSYMTIREPSRGLFRDRGSKFIALAFPVTDVSETKIIIERVRKEYHDARHHCYAYMVGPDRLLWRTNDDGEPSGTAGKPILGQINSHNLTDLIIIVVRYFGGTLLGTSGLINAYRNASADAINNSVIITREVMIMIEIKFRYESLNDVMKILKECHADLRDQHFDTECRISVSLPRSAEKATRDRLLKINDMSISDG
ncbi:MAG: YigZ family protein [Bacteroidales bacterium]|jgi:uncharacterized YigZ family protein|nr:YigZ family protein [Bacteroidales bacterium]